MILSELLDSAYEYTVDDSPNMYLAEFDDDQGFHIIVQFDKYGVDVWTLEFARDEVTKLTGAGDAPKILSTVSKIVKEFLNKKTPAFVVFAALKAERARAAVYRRIMKRAAVKYYEELKYPEERERISDEKIFDKIWELYRRSGENNEFMVIGHVDEMKGRHAAS